MLRIYSDPFMSDSEPVRARQQCQVKLDLMYRIRTVSDRIAVIREEELRMVISIDRKSRFDRLRNAEEYKKMLEEILRQHIGVHGC